MLLGRGIDLGKPVSDHPLNRGLISWWMPISESSKGKTLFDIAGTNHGSFVNNPGWTGAPHGFPALRFNNNASARYVNIGSPSSLYLTTNFTVWCWFRQEAIGTGTANLSGLVCRYNVPGAGSYSLRLSSSTLQFAGNGSVTGGSVPIKRWSLAVASVSGSTATLYVNGVQTASGNPSLSASKSPMQVTIGVDYLASPRYFDGEIGSAAISSRALSGSEVAELYKQCLTGYPDLLRRSPKGLWRAWAGSAPSSAIEYLLLESGGSVLQEDSYGLLLESSSRPVEGSYAGLFQASQQAAGLIGRSGYSAKTISLSTTPYGLRNRQANVAPSLPVTVGLSGHGIYGGNLSSSVAVASATAGGRLQTGLANPLINLDLLVGSIRYLVGINDSLSIVADLSTNANRQLGSYLPTVMHANMQSQSATIKYSAQDVVVAIAGAVAGGCLSQGQVDSTIDLVSDLYGRRLAEGKSDYSFIIDSQLQSLKQLSGAGDYLMEWLSELSGQLMAGGVVNEGASDLLIALAMLASSGRMLSANSPLLLLGQSEFSSSRTLRSSIELSQSFGLSASPMRNVELTSALVQAIGLSIRSGRMLPSLLSYVVDTDMLSGGLLLRNGQFVGDSPISLAVNSYRGRSLAFPGQLSTQLALNGSRTGQLIVPYSLSHGMSVNVSRLVLGGVSSAIGLSLNVYEVILLTRGDIIHAFVLAVSPEVAASLAVASVDSASIVIATELIASLGVADLSESLRATDIAEFPGQII